jgi:transcriptional regulator with XRE-family HTH domain
MRTHWLISHHHDFQIPCRLAVRLREEPRLNIDTTTRDAELIRLARAETVLGSVLKRDPTDEEVGRLLELSPGSVRAARRRWLSNSIRQARVNSRRTQHEIASLAGVSTSSLSRLESGERLPSKETILRLETALGLSQGALSQQARISELVPTKREVPAQLIEVSSELIKQLAASPRQLYSLPPRKFEELIAELLHDMGSDVQLTPQSKDGGRDVLASMTTPLGKLLVIVECKRYAEHRKIGAAIVERFLWTVDRKDRASLGILATTSSFTHDARLLESSNKWRLGLRDYHQLVEWLSRYGTWTDLQRKQLWTPSAELLVAEPSGL